MQPLSYSADQGRISAITLDQDFRGEWMYRIRSDCLDGLKIPILYN